MLRHERRSVDRCIAFHQIERPLIGLMIDDQCRPRRQLNRCVNGRRMLRDGRPLAEALAHDQVQPDAITGDNRQPVCGDMLECRRKLFLRLRQGQPGLDAIELGSCGTLLARRPFGVTDPRAGGHQIHRPRFDSLNGTETVPVIDRAVEQISHSRQINVRMRPNVDAISGAQPGGSHLVKEDEWTDHRPLLARERPVDLEAAEIVGDRRDRHCDWRVHACLPTLSVAREEVRRGLHGGS